MTRLPIKEWGMTTHDTGKNGNQGIGQNMAEQNADFAQPFGRCGSHIVLVRDFKKERSVPTRPGSDT